LEAAAGYRHLTHGRAVALGLLAALRLSGRDIGRVEELLRPTPVEVDKDAAWQAMQRDKKTQDGELRLVLLEESGPVLDVPVPGADAGSARNELIAQYHRAACASSSSTASTSTSSAGGTRVSTAGSRSPSSKAASTSGAASSSSRSSAARRTWRASSSS